MHALSEDFGVRMYYTFFFFFFNIFFFSHLTHPVPVTNQGTTLCLVHQLARIDMDAR